MISFFHTHFPGLLSFFSSEVNERFFMFLLVSQWWERDSSRFSQLDQESCRRHILARSRGMHLTYSAVALQVKFIAEGVVWVVEKVEVQHMDSFPVCIWGCRAAWTLWLSRFACRVYLISMCFSDLLGDAQSISSAPCSVSQKSRAKINLHGTRIPWPQTECTAGAAQVTECVHLTVDFEGNVPKYCF